MPSKTRKSQLLYLQFILYFPSELILIGGGEGVVSSPGRKKKRKKPTKFLKANKINSNSKFNTVQVSKAHLYIL